MMSWSFLLWHLVVVLAAPVILLGVIQRVKAMCTGRRGSKLTQTAFDLWRLLRKRPVYSTTSSWIFQLSPVVILAATLLAAFMVPIFPGYAPLAGEGDFIVFAYLLGLGRLFLVLSALDTGSSFEGMGASRDGSFGALVEPAFFLIVGTWAAATGTMSFQALASSLSKASPLIAVLAAGALFIMLQIEAARVPVDDPATHLELTMVHEVMILDHSGFDLAAVSYAAAVKLTLWLGLLAAVLNPFAWGLRPVLCVSTTIVLMLLGAVVVGLVEAVVARWKLAAVPYYALMAWGLGGLVFCAVLIQTWLQLG